MVFLYGNLENASSPHLQIRKVEGRKQLDGIVSSIRTQLLAGDVVFIEDLMSGDPFTHGVVRAEDVLRQLQDVPEKLREHLVIISPEKGSSHRYLSLNDARAEHVTNIWDLPYDHPFKFMVRFAALILNPSRPQKDLPPEEGPEWWPDM